MRFATGIGMTWYYIWLLSVPFRSIVCRKSIVIFLYRSFSSMIYLSSGDVPPATYVKLPEVLLLERWHQG